jgi:hypothetical protein
MSSNEEAIRNIAHQIWEAEGKPDGQAKKHWDQAVERASTSNSPDQGGLKRSIDPSEISGSEPAQPDQT